MPADPEILARDDHLLVAAKPAGMAAVPERAAAGPSLRDWLQDAVGRRVLTVHRLDKPVSGVIAFALDADSHRHLSLQFQRHAVEKVYLAWVLGEVAGEEGEITGPVHEFGSGRMGVDPRGRPSRTGWRVRERRSGLTQLELRPHTGRRHQLRVHLYWLGHPIVGDLQYGDRARQQRWPRLMLHAWRLSLRHPADGRLVRYCAEPPQAFAV